ncbi:MAG: DUF2723 domain-containing protein [candidate division Zixibacteria bacterium]|nr:DUF2723 domain-containing protein [candidate division Zixibacteria bacterium]
MKTYNRNNLFVFTTPFALSLLTYLKTICPTVYVGDSGELSLAICTLGIAHPPGYPLLTILGKAVSLLAIGNPAYTLNIFSAFLAACSAGICALIIYYLISKNRRSLISISIFIAIGFGTLWGFTNSLWNTAVGIEVYSLGALLFLLSVLMLVKFAELKDFRFLSAAVYFLSLGLANHLSIAALFIPVIYIVTTSGLNLKQYSVLGVLALLGITLYLYIPIRSSLYPLVDWNHLADFRTFYEHVTAKRYSEYISGFSFGNYFVNLWKSLRILGEQTPYYISFIGIIGIFLPNLLKSKARIILISIYTFIIFTVPIYDIPDIDQYHLPAIFVNILGLGLILKWISTKLKGSSKRAIPGIIVILLLVGTLVINYRKNDQSDNRLNYQYGMNILNSVPQNSILISVGDHANSSAYYLRYVEDIREDIEIYDPIKTAGRLQKKKVIDDRTGVQLCLEVARTNPNRTYYVKEHVLNLRNPFLHDRKNTTPNGMVYKWGNYPIDLSVWNKLEVPHIDNISYNLDFKAITMLCNLYLCKGEDYYEAGEQSIAMLYYKQAVKTALKSHEASIHNSLGIFFRRSGLPDLAKQEYERALISSHLTANEKANIYVNIGNLIKDRKRYQEANEYYDKALGIDRDHIEAGYNKCLSQAYLSFEKKSIDDAVKNFEEALKFPNADPLLIYNIAYLYENQLNDLDKAQYYYRRYLQQSPQGSEAGNVRKKLKQLQK